jgi:hypothetical protein
LQAAVLFWCQIISGIHVDAFVVLRAHLLEIGFIMQVLGLLGIKRDPRTERITIAMDPYDALLAVGQVSDRCCMVGLQFWEFPRGTWNLT